MIRRTSQYTSYLAIFLCVAIAVSYLVERQRRILMEQRATQEGFKVSRQGEGIVVRSGNLHTVEVIFHNEDNQDVAIRISLKPQAVLTIPSAQDALVKVNGTDSDGSPRMEVWVRQETPTEKPLVPMPLMNDHQTVKKAQEGAARS